MTTVRRKAQSTVDAEHIETAPAKSATLEDMFGGDDIPDEERGYAEEPPAEPEAQPQPTPEPEPQKEERRVEAPAQPAAQAPVAAPVQNVVHQEPAVQQQAPSQTLPAVQSPQQVVNAESAQAGYENKDAFNALQRHALSLTVGDLVPERYRGQTGLANAMLALDMALRMDMSPLMVMQNLYFVHGQPGWSAQFLIATFNNTKRFEPIRYRMVGEKGKPSWGYVAVTADKRTGEAIEGIEITMDIAQKEGWIEKKGSKWKTMPELMLKYRAAAFLVRTTAPEISMGLPTTEELYDIDPPASQQPVRRPIITDEV
jgi:hypothetical protein